MPVMGLLWLALGCRSEEGQREEPEGVVESTGTAPSGTDSAPGDSGAVPEVDPYLIGPALQIDGLRNMQSATGTALVLAAYGEHKGIYFADIDGGEEVMALHPWIPAECTYAALPISLDLPRGRYRIDQVYDGVSCVSVRAPDHEAIVPYGDGTYGFSLLMEGETGDHNGDGQRDIWTLGGLLLSPFFGSTEVRELRHFVNPRGCCSIVGADFDADGDGHDDLLLAWGASNGTIFYGPFDGYIETDRTKLDPMAYSEVGNHSGCNDWGMLIHDYMGTGKAVAALGMEWDTCAIQTEFYSLDLPRGSRVRQPLARMQGTAGSQTFHSAGDLNGDGVHDLVVGGTSNQRILPLPLSGTIYRYGGESFEIPTSVHKMLPLASLPDLNGDGVQELLVAWFFAERKAAYSVAFSPHPNPLVGDRAVAIAQWTGKHQLVDVNGDGLQDLVLFEPTGDDPSIPEELHFGGTMRAYYMADVMVEARRLGFAP